MKQPRYLLLRLLDLLVGCIATVQPTAAAHKMRHTEQLDNWANFYDGADWDKLTRLYDHDFDFNGSRIPSNNATQIMRDLRASAACFEVVIQPADWILDSL